MFGLLATIIAFKKGHTTFGMVTGIWTALALVVAGMGYAAYAIGPGALFFFIALGMENLNKKEIDTEATANRIVYYCKACGNTWNAYKGAAATNCPQCKGPFFRTDVPLSSWNYMSDEDKEYAKEQWKRGIYYIPKVNIPVTAKSETPEKENENLPANYNPRVVLYCKNCGKIVDVLRSEASQPHTCPSCKGQMLNTDCKLLTWDTSSKAEKKQLKEQWNAMSIAAPAVADVTSDTVAIEQPNVAIPSQADARTVSTQLFCRSCGKPLVEGAKFCRECGTPTLSVADPESTKVDEVIRFPNRCGKCGNTLFEGQKFCNKCGTPVEQSVLSPVIRIPAVEDSPATESFVSVTPKENAEPAGQKALDLSSLPAALRRAYIFIEDEEWDRAEEYLEKVLDEEPENAYAYLGKAMAAVKVSTPTLPTASEMMALMSRKEYARAKRFADPELSRVVAGWEKQVEE